MSAGCWSTSYSTSQITMKGNTIRVGDKTYNCLKETDTPHHRFYFGGEHKGTISGGYDLFILYGFGIDGKYNPLNDAIRNKEEKYWNGHYEHFCVANKEDALKKGGKPKRQRKSRRKSRKSKKTRRK